MPTQLTIQSFFTKNNFEALSYTELASGQGMPGKVKTRLKTHLGYLVLASPLQVR